MFEQLNKTGKPEQARRIMFELIEAKTDVLILGVGSSLDELIKKSQGEEKEMWELQKKMFQSQEGQGGDLKGIFEKFEDIDPAKLSPELADMYKGQKQYLEFFARRSMALDLVNTTSKIAETSFGAQKEFNEFKKQSPSEIKAALRNEGLTEWLNTDPEVYMSAAHVLELLGLLSYTFIRQIKIRLKLPIRSNIILNK